MTTRTGLKISTFIIFLVSYSMGMIHLLNLANDGILGIYMTTCAISLGIFLLFPFIPKKS